MANRQIEAKLLLSAVDKTGKAFMSVSGRLDGVSRRAAAFNRQGRSTAQTAIAVGKAAAVVGAAVGAVGVASYRKFAGDERTLTRIGITAEATREQMADIRDELFSVAKETGLQFEDMIRGLDALTASGRTLEESMALLPSVAVTAQASGAEITDIATSADALFTSMNIKAEEMQGAFDILVAGGKAGKFELRDMAQYLPSLAPAFKALGYEGEAGLQQLIAALQTVRLQTGSSGEAATAFMDVLTKMEGQTVNNNFKKFGVDLRGSLAKARKEGEDILQAFIRISEETVKGDLSKLPQLFTDKQMLIAMRSLVTGGDAFEKFVSSLNDVDGSALRDLGIVMQDNQAKIDAMATSWDRLMGNLGASVAPALGGVLDSFNEKIEFTEALKKGLEDEDLSWLHKKAILAYPNKNDPWIIENAKQGGYKYETFDGGNSESPTDRVPLTQFRMPKVAPIPIQATPEMRTQAGKQRRKASGLDHDWVIDQAYREKTKALPVNQPGGIFSNFDESGKFTGNTDQIKLSAELETADADQALEQFNAKAEKPLTATLDLDTTAAEQSVAKLKQEIGQISDMTSSIGSGSRRNRGVSMPGAKP